MSPIMNTRRGSRLGFTLIELLVVIAIIGVLAALLFPALGIMNARSKKAKCLSNVRQIATAGVAQFGESRESLPARTSPTSYGEAAEQLLPYLKNLVAVFDCPANNGAQVAALPSYAGKYTDYEFNPNLCSTPGSKRSQGIIVDASQVVFAYDPPLSVSKVHVDGFNASYLDGHAGFTVGSTLSTTNGLSL